MSQSITESSRLGGRSDIKYKMKESDNNFSSLLFSYFRHVKSPAWLINKKCAVAVLSTGSQWLIH